MKNKYTLRKLINDIHLWLGLASGLVLFVVCLSGTVYTFHHDVEEWLEPEKFYTEIPAGTNPIPLSALLPRLQQELKGNITAIEIPADPERNYRITVKNSPKPTGAEIKPTAAGANPQEAKKPRGRDRGKSYYIDPYTGTVRGMAGGSTAEFFTTVMKLHRWLLIEGDTGKIIVGSATIIFVLLTISGLVLWFPARLRYWKQGLKIKTKANWKRINHDLHNTLGFYSFILLLIMGLTGLCWSFDWYRTGVSEVMGAQVFKGRGEKPLPSPLPDGAAATIGIEDAVRIANKTLPYSGNLNINLPEGPEGSYAISKYKTGFFALSASDKLQINQYTGGLLKLERFADKPLNEKIVASIKPLHIGTIYGGFSKILYFIACLIATSLPVTGTLIWINKLKKKPGVKSKRGDQA